MPLYRLQYNISSDLFATGIQYTGKIAHKKSCHRIKAVTAFIVTGIRFFRSLPKPLRPVPAAPVHNDPE
mgnify:FL=1